jgi:type II secretory pathway pseudopilin PulG
MTTMRKWNVIPTGSDGFSYLAVMAIIVIIGISLTATGYQWKTMAKREKEKELLFRGTEIRSAIIQYVNADPLKRYPHSLEDLIKDPKNPNVKRYLRKIYKDPMTDKDFILILDPSRGLVGVHSGSSEKPLKTANFRASDRCFEGKKEYREWLFMIGPPLQIQPGILPKPSGEGEGETSAVRNLLAPPCPSMVFMAEEKK